MADLINETDSLNQGRVKINKAIEDSEKALNTANNAEATANQALQNSESTQTQLDTIVIEGDSSVEAAQARVKADGTTFPTLRDRLNASDAQLAQIAVNVKSFGAKGDGSQYENQYIQDAIDFVANSGGGKVLIPPGDYKLNLTSFGAIYLWDNVILEGSGYESYLYIDPTITIPSIIHTIISIGDNSFGAKNVRVKNIRVKGHQSVLAEPNGKYIQGINARQSAQPLEYTENVIIEECYVEDTNIPIGCSKNTDDNFGTTERILSQHRNWNVRGNIITKATNKGIELQECRDSKVENNLLDDVVSGLQAICASENILFKANKVKFKYTGLDITQSVSNIIAEDNYLESLVSTTSSCISIRNEPYELESVIKNIKIRGNICENLNSFSIWFETRPGNLNTSFEAIHFDDNKLNGKVILFDRTVPGLSSFKDIKFTDNRILSIQTKDNNYNSMEDIVFKNNVFMTLVDYFGSNTLFVENIVKNADIYFQPVSSNNVAINNIANAVKDDGVRNLTYMRNIQKVVGSYFQQYGNVNSESNPIRVTFPKPFKEGTTPNVIVSPTSNQSGVEAYAYNINNEGFDLYAYRDGIEVITLVSWMANGVL